MKRQLITGIFSLMTILAIHALGSKDTEDTPVENLDSWLETVDISQKKPGKYNILITAEDLAGNQGFAGPYNIYIDPDSDLPVTQITNPLDDMRVPGNLNIVGTSIDDDAIDYVEIILDDNETPIRAEGKEFWSFYLDTTAMSEGAHTISVYGVDVFGVRGKPHSVTWHLDRNRPETTVTNLEMGVLVSGKFVLSGTVADGNGIRELYYSLDNGETYSPVSVKHDKDTGLWRFSLDIESQDMPDGPAVCWFKAVDGKGSEGVNTFLYFVDNTPPDVGIISPLPEEAVNGVFSVSGYARDILGVARLSWNFDKESGDFEIVKGNPYWVKEFDISDIKTSSVDFLVTAEDTAGNITTLKHKIPVDQSLDIPSLEIFTPEPDEIFDNLVLVTGFAKDDDAIAGIRYTVDEGEYRTITSSGSFGIELDGLSAGTHSIEVLPVDVHGVTGKPVTRSFVVAGAPPEILVDTIEGPLKQIHSEDGKELTVIIVSESGLEQVSWQLTGRDTQNASMRSGVKEHVLRVPVGYDVPFGLVNLSITAKDIYGREKRSNTVFHVTNLSIPRGSPPDISDDAMRASVEVTIPETSKVPASTGTAVMTIERVFNGEQLFENGMSITLSGPNAPRSEQNASNVLVGIDSPVPVADFEWTLNSGEKRSIRTKKVGDTRYEATLVLDSDLPADWTVIDATAVLKDGSRLSVRGYVCVVRPVPPAGVFDDEQFVWGDSMQSPEGAILLLDGKKVSGLFNGRPDATAVDVRFDRKISGLDLSLSGNVVTVAGSEDGEYAGVRLVITDSDGESYTSVPFTFIVDSSSPELVLNDFDRPLWLQNELRISGTARDAFGIRSVEYSLDNGLTWVSFEGAQFDRTLDLSALEDGPVVLLVKATDRAGRMVNDWHVFTKDTTPPVVETVFPEPADIVNGETRIGFRFTDASGMKAVEYRAPGDRSSRDRSEYVPVEIASLTHTSIGTAEKPIDDNMEFRFTDPAGNTTTLSSWFFSIDSQADKPVVEIHLPVENEVLRKDFIISGVVYDDDEPAKIWYRIDNGAYTEIPVQHSFSIPVTLQSLTDNEHTISMYAEDIHGVRGDEVIRNIRVSLEEPRASVVSPSFETTNSGVIDITGVASDKNGIDYVEISLDNGNTYNRAEGAESWSYRFDTRVIQDGTHVIFVRVFDKYGTAGLYSSMLNIDNTPPSIRLELPIDGSRIGDRLFISGQSLDNIKLERVQAKISNINPKQPSIPVTLRDIPFENALIISESLPVSSLAEGFYNLEVSGYDRAGNITRVSRNFEVYRGVDRNRIEFLYPMNGEKVQGMFKIYGKVLSESPVENLLLYIDGEHTISTNATPSGYYEFTVDPEIMTEGEHTLAVQALAADEKIIRSEDHTVIYSPAGPWVTIDNLVMGDFAVDRPWLSGSAGYAFTEEDVFALNSKETSREQKRQLQMKSVDNVEISFDNGKTFHKTESGKKWRYRIETGDLKEGFHFLLVRARMKNGEVAVTRTIVQIDKTLPSILLISPGEGGKYNNELVFSGLSSDDIDLDSVVLSLRPGDKSRYAIPAFIQGLYFDWHFWGATLYDIGVGLTFFDDNVKIQLQFGQFTAEQRAVFTTNNMRYGGNVIGLKLLANIAYVPLDYFFGPDFQWLSATAAVGANFSLFTETQSGQPQILSAILVQLEFPRITLAKRKTFRTFSLYTEGQFWFIPTDVDSSEVNIESILPHITGGIRVNIF